VKGLWVLMAFWLLAAQGNSLVGAGLVDAAVLHWWLLLAELMSAGPAIRRASWTCSLPPEFDFVFCVQQGNSIPRPLSLHRNGLSQRFGLELPATLVFSYPTPSSLAAHVAAELNARDVTANGIANGTAHHDDGAGGYLATSEQQFQDSLDMRSSAVDGAAGIANGTAAPSAAELERQLAEILAEVAGVALGGSGQQPLLEGGLDSIGAVELRWVLVVQVLSFVSFGGCWLVWWVLVWWVLVGWCGGCWWFRLVAWFRMVGAGWLVWCDLVG
jgi:acyl carrier protein